jgi:16S rRNA processing protein RimM
VAAPAQPHRVCVARLGAAHGVRGEVKLWSFTADPAAVAGYGPFETADGRVVEIETLRPAKDFFVARLKGVADRDAAERLRNAELFVPRERLPAPEDSDEFYHADLIGLAVVDASGAGLGSVVAVHNFGAGDIIEVRRTEGGDTVMLPFTQAAVPAIDVAAGRIVVAADAFEAASAPSPTLPRKRGRGAA